ncbi:FecR family protein [Parapedobacter sp. 10938]|uniref:FecR family protein n=1 Tax=Parapedobacter flavus TaxID=3110225 RepID=UPI002DBB0B68|nr:FecR domain-containing protein [Parapedobacter sp. 10938]MEC3879441.1 FecR domain-containing protein [Parapedobacter sp. 10938]
MYKPINIKRIIRRGLEGKLTGQEAAVLKSARLIYEENELLELEMDVLEEMAAECPRGVFRQRNVDAGAIIRAERKQYIRQLLTGGMRVCAGIAVLWLIGAGVLALNQWWSERTLPSAYEKLVMAGYRIPPSEFACTVYWGNSVTVVGKESRGRLGRFGDKELRRSDNGELELVRLPSQFAFSAGQQPAIRVVTGAQQQCAVRLPDGSLIRLDAGSSFSYPTEKRGAPNTEISLAGRALIRVREHTDRHPRTVVLRTANGSMTTQKGEFAVLANRTDTRVTLLEGRVEAQFPIDDGYRVLTNAGDQVTYDRCCTDAEGNINMTLSGVTRVDPWQEVAWTTKERNYRNVPLRAFVLEMNRTYNLGVTSVSCIPETKTITASIHFKDPVDKIYGYIRKAGLPMYESNGMISFCGPDLDPGPLRYLDGIGDSLDLMDVLHGRERLAWVTRSKKMGNMNVYNGYNR